MARQDLKAIGYGFATFIACTLLMSLAGTTVGSGELPSLSGGRLAIVKSIGFLAPVIAGYVAARQALTRRILHGTIGGSIGVLLLIAPAIFIPAYQSWGTPFIIAWYAALAYLGAIFGDHRANRVGL